MRKNLGCNGHCPNVFMTPIPPVINFLRVVVVDFFCIGGGCGGFGGKTNRHLSSKSRILLPPRQKGQGWRILAKILMRRRKSNLENDEEKEEQFRMMIKGVLLIVLSC